MQPFISICIPSYKNKDFLIRTLDSIVIQTYKDFEVVISDDSPDESVQSCVVKYKALIPIRYTRNNPALGSPANWNNAIDLAQGQWIKMMHDDDWFSGSDSLAAFASAAKETKADLVFSGYTNVSVESNEKKVHVLSEIDRKLLQKSPLNLLKKNSIGHPSTTLIRNKPVYRYDENLRWLVDMDFYIHVLGNTRGIFTAIEQPLLNIGISREQITYAVFRNPTVEIPESVYMLNKLGIGILRKIWVYDYYWRLIRNLSIRNTKQVRVFTKEMMVPDVFDTMINQQRKIPVAWLGNGIVSKLTMGGTYLWNRLNRRLK